MNIKEGTDICTTKPTITMDTEYEYDERGNVTKIHSTTALDEPTLPYTTTVYNGHDNDEDDDDAEYGVALESVIETSPLETILTAAAGAFLGNVIYQIARKMIEK